MVLPLTGSNDTELLNIETDKISLIIKGIPSHPNSDVLNINKGTKSRLIVNCTDDVKVQVYDIQTSTLEDLEGEIYPIFYEQRNYQLLVEYKEPYNVAFYHQNETIRRQVSKVGRHNILMGVINFTNDIGYSDLIILVDGKEYLKITLEVFPSKIEYQNDYYNILQDINREIHNLAFDFLRKTYQQVGLNNNVGSSLTEFYSILTYMFDRFISSVEIILKRPHHILIKEENVVPYHKIKKVSTKTIKWLEKYPENAVLINGYYLPNRGLNIKKSISYDTFENRFIKYILALIERRLQEVKKKYLMLSREKESEVIESIERMSRKVRNVQSNSFLKNVGDIHHLNSLSLVLNMAPGYKDVYKYYLMLLRGLSIEGEVFNLSIKDLALLYEYWCFIKINSILRTKYKLIQSDVVKVNTNGIFVTLKKSKNSSVTYENPRNGERFVISYNESERKLPTVNQKPDNVLSIEKTNSTIKYQYIMDAKYRINPALEGSSYKRTYTSPGPEEDDINTMHRYRDAIVHSNKESQNYEKTTFGSYILFPYREEEIYKEHRFYKSIEAVNIGALPFLPGSIKLVEEFLDNLIEDSSYSSFERSTTQKGLDEYIDSYNFNSRDVLVAPVKNAQQLQANLKYSFYHMPLENINKADIKFDYIALYQPKTQFGEGGIEYYGKILTWDIVSRRDMKEIPKDSEKLYIKFQIDKFIKLKKSIKAKEFGIRRHIFTSKFLLDRAEYVPELCIKSYEEFRLWYELKRIDAEYQSKIISDSQKQQELLEFRLQEKTISILQGKIRIMKEDVVRELDVNTFRSNPRTIINIIRKI